MNWANPEELAAEWRQMAEEKEALRKDAERYRWLRDKHPIDGTLWVAKSVPTKADFASVRYDQLDAAIDAEMEARR